ncbi:MAG: hypothetical protein JST50_07590 [Bacteroidetes bacterium]|jgi:hypothetical protein|nr:hypothetical protein [Bacteroidota bacterium]
MTRKRIGRIRKSLIIITYLVIEMGLVNSHAQELPDLQRKIEAYQKNNLTEKLYVHVNKNAFLTGEILWFKIYNTDGATNKLLDISKVVYVEILDYKHAPVLQAKIAMKNGVGYGSFYLPFSVGTGNYMLRAYTNWMKNFDAGYYFEKQISILNTVKASPEQPKPASSYDVQFLPEGGHLVKGLNSKVAFKVAGFDGKGRDCSGTIINSQNDTVARFKSLKFGIGSFDFTPTETSGYKAIIKTGSDKIVKDFPEISPAGYVLCVTNQNNQWEASIQNPDNNSTKAVYLVVHNRHVIESGTKGTLSNGIVHFNIDKAKIVDGVSYVTLFDDQQRPLCERLIFKRPNRKLTIAANTDATMYDKRAKVDLNISTKEAANLSVSVYKLDSLQKDDAMHIASYLWLSADLKGRVESPDYYIDNNNQEANQALDNLLLTQGWRQFDWTKILTGEKPRFKFMPEYSGHIVTGTLVNSQTNQPAKDIFTYLTVTGPKNQLYVTKSDSTGRLLFNTRNFYGPREIIMQNKWQQDSIYHINVTSPFSDQYIQEKLPAFTVNSEMRNEIVRRSLDMQVQNIFFAKQIKQFNESSADSTMFYGKPDYTYLLDDYTRFTNIEEVVHEYVRLVVITRDHGKRSFQIIRDKSMLPGEPLVILDSKPIFDIDKAYNLDPLKIKRLDVVTSNYLYGPVVFNGILHFTSYNGSSATTELDPRAMVFDYDGLQLDRKFYSPVYDTDQERSSTIPDFRNVLYWNPDAGTDQKGTRKLSFYTSDKPGRYIGVIEGIAQNGEAGTQHFYFEVKK